MRILVTGYTGQLGYDVVQYGVKLGLDMIGIGSRDVDITDEEQVSTYIRQVKPDVIVHCAAYTAVDKAEDDRETCWKVNVEGTKHLVKAARDIDAKFMYISTDYVFNGEGERPFTESDIPSPIGYYGRTKYEGEQMVEQWLEKYFIVRISWVFGVNGANFVKTMLRLAETRNELYVVGDQFGSPTYTFDVARLVVDMVQTDQYGLYHASNEGFCSWAQFADEIFRQANLDVKIHSIPTEKYPTRAVRPKNSRMSKQKLIDNGFTPLPSWQNAVGRFIKELKEVE